MRLSIIVCLVVCEATAHGEPERYESVTLGEEPPAELSSASSSVTREELEERASRSTPDALRYEPGVVVQQTSTGQASAFIRGRTGQQTLLLFDGIRLNNSLYRQGPNQYLFTVDPRSIGAIDVVRGGGSTRWGSDAIGGAVLARALRPKDVKGVRGYVRGATADGELGARVQAAGISGRVAWLVGAGARSVGMLESGGPLISPATGRAPDVPRLADDGHTQLGTGFDELTADVRVEITPRGGRARRWTLAAYEYDELDAPRTDQCPPPLAPRSECLTIDRQARTLAYAALDATLGRYARRSRFVVSYQRQLERRTRRRPTSFVENHGTDQVHTLGLSADLTSRRFARGPGLRLQWGGDVYHDRVGSEAATVFTDLDVRIPSLRGQYLDGSHHTTSGLFAIVELGLRRERGLLFAGSRLALSAAFAPRDRESGAGSFTRTFVAPVAFLGGRYPVRRDLELLATLDRSFRAPNLDDLTARQTVGPGFQFENASLAPETSLSAEVGFRFQRPSVALEAWVFDSSLGDAIVRTSRRADECPPASAECRAAATRFQLVNAPGRANIIGGEAAMRWRLPEHLDVRASVSYAHGSTENSQPRPTDPSLPYQERVPLSRVPPLGGNLELGWRPRLATVAVAVRWATLADRLAPSDLSDARIPAGGTPGYVVMDVRARLRATRHLLLGLVFENIADTAYRTHGSSVNGPGRGVILSMEIDL